MQRKKWTPLVEATDAHLKLREKKRWQLALRRYVVEKNVCTGYSIYFGLSIEQFRKWIELQLTEGLNWENFGSLWQFNHVVPVAYFDFSVEEDLQLCWSFINIRVERVEPTAMNPTNIDIIAARPYFEALYNKTSYDLFLKMIKKLISLEKAGLYTEPLLEKFIIEHKPNLEKISTLSKEEFNNLNTGMTLEDILLEKEIIRKFS